MKDGQAFGTQLTTILLWHLTGCKIARTLNQLCGRGVTQILKGNKMETLKAGIYRIFDLAHRDAKNAFAMLAKLMEEVGETAEQINHSAGYLPHKTMKEPLVQEIADVVQCAIGLYAKMNATLSDEELITNLVEALRVKNDKWESVLPNRPGAWPSAVKRQNPLINAVKNPTGAVAQGAAVPQPPATPNTPLVGPKQKIFVNVRTHPLKTPQPLGVRKVTRMEIVAADGKQFLKVGIGNEGKGWTFPADAATPKWMDFRLGSPKGMPVSMQVALRHFKV